MLVLLFCKLSEQYSQTTFPIIKPFKVTNKKKKKNGRYLYIIDVFSRSFQETECTNVKIKIFK